MTDPLNEMPNHAHLREEIDKVPRYEPPKEGAASAPPDEAANDNKPVVFTPTPFKWRSPASIPPREWLYGHHLSRKYVSVTIGPGGMGKSSLLIADALSLVTGRSFTGTAVYGGPKRVWMWNEDPVEEMERRIVAAMEHFGITPEEVEGRLFIESFRTTPLCIATTGREGIQIARPVVDGVVAALIARQIDVLSIDPFVKSHRVPENDNGAMDAAANEWNSVAERANCAVELAHHTKKLGGEEATSESSRGGGALVSAARSTRVLNRMTKAEAERAGLSTPARHFSAYDDKNNMTPRAEAKDWFEFVSVDLGNGDGPGAGDNVGVVVPWQWPNVLDEVTVADLLAVQRAIDGKDYGASVSAADWAGRAVAEVLGLDVEDAADKERVKTLLKIWIANGALNEDKAKVPNKGRERPVIRVGTWALSPTSRSGVGEAGEVGV